MGQDVHLPRVWEIASLELGKMAYPGEPVSGSFEIALGNQVESRLLDVEVRWVYQRTRSDLFHQVAGEAFGPPAAAVLVCQTARVPLGPR